MSPPAESGPNGGPGGRSLQRMWPVAFAGLSATSGVLPIMALGPFALLMRDAVALDEATLGFLFGIFFTGALVGTAAGPLVLARIGAERSIAVGTLVSAAACVALGLTESILMLLTVSALAGVANGFVQPGVNVFIMQKVAEHQRGFAFGLRVAGVPAASGLAALAATLVSAVGVDWRFFYFVCALGIGALTVGAFMHESHEPAEKARNRGGRGGRVGTTVLVLSASGLLASASTSVLAPFLVGGLVWKGVPFGTAAFVVGVAGVMGVASRVAVGLIADRIGSPRTHLGISTVMLLVSGIGMAAIGWIPGNVSAVAAALLSYGIGWAWPGLLHFAALQLNPHAHAAVAAQMQFGTFGGAIAGPVVFGALSSAGGQGMAWGVFGLFTLVAAAGFVIAIAMSKRRPA